MMMHPHFHALLSFFGFISLGFESFAADPLDTWTERRPAADSFYLRDIIFAQDKFVTVGTTGSVLTSPDGREWTPQQLPEQPNILGDIAYGRGLFVAVGSWNQSGIIFTSADAVTWELRRPGTAGFLNGIVFAQDKFVVVGASGGQSLILESEDGIAWRRTSNLPGYYGQICFGE